MPRTPKSEPQSVRNSDHPSAIRRAIAPVLEALEGRQLMSAVTFHKHHATVQGSKGDDDIRVFLSADKQIVHIVVNGDDTTRSASKVSRVTVFGRMGNDNILFDEYQKPKLDKIRGELYGGRGNDTITGGAADDIITGGKGDDDLAGMDGDNHVFGLGGTDTIEGVREDSAEAKEFTETGKITPHAVSIPSFIVRDIGLLQGGTGDRIPFALN